ncbi:hypothetical protein [Neptunicella marina]|uniref:Uncharacterized protein n=1 Tax=Neptunicella marina TaxID=2125989 RepID=A0A8J6M392_9ALTE|nr:hypothetical protein [Neptunicella marina]MBC3765186.1 hypothetical protein [Neptunicella marina]
MSILRRGKDKYGSYEITVEDSILIVSVKGAFGEGLVNNYTRDLTTTIDSISHKKWGYLAYALELEALTNQGFDYLKTSFAYSVANNCIADAYCVTSPLAIAQIDKIRQLFDLHSPVEERLFNDLASAKQFLHEQLEQFS